MRCSGRDQILKTITLGPFFHKIPNFCNYFQTKQKIEKEHFVRTHAIDFIAKYDRFVIQGKSCKEKNAL